jgi:glycerol kinase
VPASLLPEVKDSAADFGATEKKLFGAALPVAGMAGDQQAALVGQAGFGPGMIKSTYGTGCFVVLNTGEQAVTSKNRLLTTLAYRLGGKPTYAIEGSIFVAGAAVQWLRDGLKLIAAAGDSQALAASIEHNHGVYLVPAFTGLGAPVLGPGGARGAVRADPGYRDRGDRALGAGGGLLPDPRPDGGDGSGWRHEAEGAQGGWRDGAERLGDAVPGRHPGPAGRAARGDGDDGAGGGVSRGAAGGLFKSTADIAKRWQRDRLFEPRMKADQREALYAGWRSAVARVRSNGAG